MSTKSSGAASARESFSTRWGFVLACIGSVVGMGNIWMFPGRVSRYGGGSYLIAYILFVVIIGFSGVIGEMAFGRATGSGPIGAFQKAFKSRGWNEKIGFWLGVVPVVGSLALAVGYSVVVGWILKYTVGSFVGFSLSPDSLDGFGAAFGGMAQAFGNTGWQLAGLAATFYIMSAGITNGIEKANKIMIPLFFVMFVGLGVYIAFRPGASEGYKYIFSVDPAAFRNPMTWIFALGQAFFSLSLAGNGTLIYGSYLKKDVDIINSAAKVAFFDTAAALMAALVIIPAVAAAGARLDAGGPGLIFIYLPHLFKSMPGGRLIMIIFFLSVLFAGVTSLINLFEVSIATLQERMGLSRVKAVLAIAVIGTASSVVIQGIVGGWMDFVSIYVCPLGAAMAGIIFYWVFGGKYARTELQKGRAKEIGPWLEPMTKYVFCVMTVIVFILSCVTPGGIG
ncbi:MAG: sodium-dependent transporter [Cloacibacillus sp.]